MSRNLKSKVFLNMVEKRRHRRLCTIYIEHNLFQQSNLERDVERKNTHNDLFQSHLDKIKVRTLSAHLGLRLELFHWYGNAASVPNDLLLIDLSPRTDDP